MSLLLLFLEKSIRPIKSTTKSTQLNSTTKHSHQEPTLSNRTFSDTLSSTTNQPNKHRRFLHPSINNVVRQRLRHRLRGGLPRRRDLHGPGRPLLGWCGHADPLVVGCPCQSLEQPQELLDQSRYSIWPILRGITGGSMSYGSLHLYQERAMCLFLELGRDGAE